MTDLEASLADALTDGPWEHPDFADDEYDDCGEVHPRWTIGGKEQASWALRKMAIAHRAIEEASRLHDAEQARLDAWLESATRVAHRTLRFFEARLVEYLRGLRADDPGLHTLPLPGGRLVHRSSQQVAVTDEEAFMAWAETAGYPEAVKRSPQVSAVKRVLAKAQDGTLVPVTEDGEVVPGIECRRVDHYKAEPA